MRYTAVVLSPVLLLLQVGMTLAVAADAKGFIGSESCQDCHIAEYNNWRESHHDQAMQLPSADTVLGDFSDTKFTYNGTTSRFYRNGDKYLIRTDGEDGKLTDFEVAYVFGVYPLQQYLLPLSRGRLQAFAIAWDARSLSEGGQRWFHLYPDEAVDHTDALHWSGTYFNWNTRCAECHSTDVRKNYSAATRTFDTQFEELDVGCEACHGPGEKHIDLARNNALTGSDNGGFPVGLGQRGSWTLDQGANIAKRSEPLASNTQIDNCARCHSLRSTLGEYHYGDDLLDTHRLSVLQAPQYHADGQILEEVYVYGSFVQSRMHQAGVVCSNCHEPHSLALRAPANGVCAQCHLPSRYDTTEHHHHQVGSTGADCANCHMPESTYMVVDPRRDHSIRIPRPELTQAIGTPNACNQCHTDRDAQWSVDSMREWGLEFTDTSTHPALAFANFEQGVENVAPTLADIVADSAIAPVWRATAIEALGRTGNSDALQRVIDILYDDDPLLRASAVRSLGSEPLQRRFQLLMPLVEDKITAVRMAVASSLAGVPLEQIPSQHAGNLQQLFDEYIAIQTEHADMPAVQMQIGSFMSKRGDALAAENAYHEAIAINPSLVPAYLNLAELMRAVQREEEEQRLLLQALDIEPQNGATLHALGLLETRARNRARALDYLGRAAALEINGATSGTRHRFVYAIALHDYGQPQEAIVQLKALLRAAPDNIDTLLALANYHRELGEVKPAEQYAQMLIRLEPGNQSFRQLYQQLTAPAKNTQDR